MSLINLIRIALKALQRNKLRAFLTMLGIIIGVGSVIAMVAIGQGSKQSIHDQLSNMGTNMITVQPASNLNGGVRIAGGAREHQSQHEPGQRAEAHGPPGPERQDAKSVQSGSHAGDQEIAVLRGHQRQGLRARASTCGTSSSRGGRCSGRRRFHAQPMRRRASSAHQPGSHSRS